MHGMSQRSACGVTILIATAGITRRIKNELNRRKCGGFTALRRRLRTHEAKRKAIALVIGGSFRQRFAIVGHDVAPLQERIHG
jgi:hypothetical protein